MNWLHYLVEANLYLSIFYLCYCLFLNKETYYTFNRLYLLFTCIAAFIIPIVQLGVLKPTAPVYRGTIIVLPGNVHHITNQQVKIVHEVGVHFTLQDYILFGYLFGALILLLLFFFKLYKLLKFTRVKSVLIEGNYKLIHINNSNTAFSFFNYLFIGTSTSDAATIIRHELVHIRQKHSFDIILLELLKVINWFNPFVYLLQNSLKTVHEYIADENTIAAHADTLSYSTFLLNNAYGVGGSSITHSFFNYNLLKKRIIMLNQKRSGSLARLKYLVTVPLCAGLLCVSTLGFSKTYGLIDLMPQKTDTVLIAPAPPPEPPQLNHVVQFKTPSAPFGSITTKGYRYAQAGYLVDGKSYFKVIIQESKNVQKEYWKNRVTAAEVQMLRDKYGYTFPSMPLYAKLPPPPPAPAAPGNIKIGPPPAAQPKKTKLQLPSVIPDDTVKSGQVIRDTAIKNTTVSFGAMQPSDLQVNHNEVITIHTGKEIVTGRASEAHTILTQKPGGKPLPLIFVNGIKYNVKDKIKPGQQIIISAADSALVYTEGDLYAKRKYGDVAKDGVVELYGKPTFTIK